MARQAHLAGKANSVFDDAAPGNTDLSHDEAVASDPAVVPDMDEIVDPGALADRCVAE
jgi:hypothetical protein